MSYPSEEDITRHTEQLVTSIRQYIGGWDERGKFLKNNLRSLFTDLLLEANKHAVEVDFDELIRRISQE